MSYPTFSASRRSLPLPAATPSTQSLAPHPRTAPEPTPGAAASSRPKVQEVEVLKLDELEPVMLAEAFYSRLVYQGLQPRRRSLPRRRRHRHQ